LNTISTYLDRIPSKYKKIGGLIIGACLILIVLGISIVLTKRNALLAEAVAKMKEKALDDYGLDLKIGKVYFSGLSSVTFENVFVLPIAHDQLVSMKYMEVGVKILPLLTGNVKVDQLNVTDARITFKKQDSISNYDFLFRRHAADTSRKGGPLNLAAFTNRMINSILYKIPDDMKLRGLELSYRDDSLLQKMTVPEADIDNGKLNAMVHVNDREALWHLEGDINTGKKRLFFRLFGEGQKIELPLLEKKYGLKLTFDTLETQLRKVEWNGDDELRMSGSWRVGNLLMNHWRIASNDVVVPNAFIDAEIEVGKDYVSLDKESEIKINALKANPYARITFKPHKMYSFGLRTPYIEAQEVFDSFPTGLFTSLEGIKVSGEMAYQLDFFLDTELPDSVKLFSAMSEKSFRVNSWGATNLAKINSDFVYTPYEEGKPVRNIVVGPANPDFVTLDEVSPNLKHAILTAEDPSFFAHEGFVPQAIRAAIATNYKEKAFKRGGSTISMQLVKNVYLVRDKTLARKIEEMLLVWLIEHNKIVSKQRLFEVYLNIIEWGKNVYGISEAARYYFLKRPSELTIGESIFLASIVPRPKTGLYRFDANGGVRPYMSEYFRLIGGLMARRGYTPYDSSGAYGLYSVSLRNAILPAKHRVDSLKPDMNPDLEKEVEEAQKMLEEMFKDEIGKSE